MLMQGIGADTVRQRINSRTMSSSECEHLQCEHARFGYAVSNVGDLDRDGFPGQ